MRPGRALLVATPAVAMATVALGLRIGGGGPVRAALVMAAPASSAGAGLAWQLVVLDEDRGVREPVALPDVDVIAKAGGRQAHWHGATNEDGVAEMSLALPAGPIHVEARADRRLLASGDAAPPPNLPPSTPGAAWARFARREGPVALDVAVLGQRAASGFAASVWVQARDRRTGAPLAGVAIAIEPDPGLTPAAPTVTTDERGWAHVTATPLGFSVPLLLHARTRDERTGEWAGGLFISPGASFVAAKDVYRSDEDVAMDVTVPTVRTTAYVEIDDARGRVWATAAPVRPSGDAMPRTTVVAPKLRPGLYWAVAAGDMEGASRLGPGSIVRPFFVATNAEQALSFGTDPVTCAPPGDERQTARAVSQCLARVAPATVPRWTAVDGFADHRVRDAAARARGMAIAMTALVAALVLETLLLLRAAAVSRARLRAAEHTEEAGDARLVGRGWSVAIGLLLGVLGFALLGAFLARLG